DIALDPGQLADRCAFLRAHTQTLTEPWTMPWKAPRLAAHPRCMRAFAGTRVSPCNALAAPSANTSRSEGAPPPPRRARMSHPFTLRLPTLPDLDKVEVPAERRLR